MEVASTLLSPARRQSQINVFEFNLESFSQCIWSSLDGSRLHKFAQNVQEVIRKGKLEVTNSDHTSH